MPQLQHSARLLSVLATTVTSDRIKSLLVRTPAEGPLHAMRAAWAFGKLWRRPELHAIHTEDLVISRVLPRLIHADSCCVDVGGHVGSTLSTYLRLAPHGRHAAFEPIPNKARWLRRRFPEVDVHELALSDREGEATFYVNTRLSGFSGLRAHGDDAEHMPLTVRTARLDDVLTDRRVDFLKIDVEGGELGVLQGAAGLLARARPWILFECTATGLRAHGLRPQDVLGWLQAHDLAVWTPLGLLTGEPPLDLPRFVAALSYPFQALNFFARTHGCAEGTDARASQRAGVLEIVADR